MREVGFARRNPEGEKVLIHQKHYNICKLNYPSVSHLADSSPDKGSLF